MTERLEARDEFTHATIPIRYVAEMLSAQGDAETSERLARVGIPVEALSQPGYRVAGAQIAALHDALVRDHDDELYGAFRRRVPRGSYASFLRLATAFPTLRDALVGAIDFYGLFDLHAPWELREQAALATLRLRPRDPRQRGSLMFTHMMLLTAWRTSAWLGGESNAPREVGLDRRFAEYVPQTRFLFQCETRLIRAASFLRFDRSMLDLPVRRTRTEALAWAKTESFAAMIGRPPRGALETRVRTALASCSPPGSGQQAEVARRLGMSVQTLARQLRERGQSFRKIRDGIRRDLAVTRLSQGQSVAEVAEALGFSQPSAFQRAFKTWTGVPPGRYRR